MTSRLIQSLGLEPQYLEGCARVSVCALARSFPVVPTGYSTCTKLHGYINKWNKV